MKKQKDTINKALKNAVLIFTAEIYLDTFCDMKKLPVVLLTCS